MTELIFIDGLPPSVGKGGLVKLLIETGGLRKEEVGKIRLNGGMATIEVPQGLAAKLVRALDGCQVETRNVRAWRQPHGSSHDHFEQLRRWLALEAEADKKAAQEQASRPGTSERADTLNRLVVKGSDIGLGGRVMVQLGPRNEQARLPWTRLSAGSPVLMSEEGNGAGGSGVSWRGVVNRVSRSSLEIAFNQEPELEGGSYRVQLAGDEIARQRMERAMAQAEAARADRHADLRDVLLNHQPALYRSYPHAIDIEPYIAHLNPSQKTAVIHALSAEDAAIIHGPPGTGKTTAVAALIAIAAAAGEKVLACAPSNLAVDNIAEGLLAAGVKMVRLGHPVRVLESLQDITLDALVAGHEDFKQAKRMRIDASNMLNQAGKYRRAKPAPGEKQSIRREAKAMLDEARGLESSAVERVLDGAQVILSTLTGIDSAVLGQRAFDLGVIDEAGQSVEPASWIPVPRVNRLILAGDHCQLPPTILSRQAEGEGFGVSLMEQLVAHAGDRLARRLDIQYRMHQQIMGFSSAEFYDDSLQPDDSVASHLLAHLPGVTPGPLTGTPVSFIDTAGASYDEMLGEGETSRSNPMEAALVEKKVRALLDAGLPAEDIAVITPYSAQVRLLRETLPEAVEINSVDGFQGREKEAVIISLVRSNIEGDVGFLAETRRMNVALTRARRLLLVIGDSGTISVHPFYTRLLDYFDRIGAYNSVWEEMD